MITRIARRFFFSTTNNKTYGNLKDSDRIFTNVYKDTDPYISGALRRVLYLIFREIGTRPKILLLMDQIGSLMKLNFQDLGAEEEQDFHQDSSILSCPKLPLPKDLPI